MHPSPEYSISTVIHVFEQLAPSEVLAKINEIPGVVFGEDVLTKRARIPIEKLTSNEAVEKLKTVMAWLIGQVKADLGKENA